MPTAERIGPELGGLLWVGLGRRRLSLVVHKAFHPLSARGYHTSSSDATSQIAFLKRITSEYGREDF